MARVLFRDHTEFASSGSSIDSIQPDKRLDCDLAPPSSACVGAINIDALVAILEIPLEGLE